MNNRSMPSCSIIPVLGYDDVAKAIDWLCTTFGFRERWRAGNHRAQLSIGNGTIAVTGRDMIVQPSFAYSLMVQVPDVDSHYQQALEQGAEVLQLPADFPYGERQYSVADIGGYSWTFSQSIADLAPEDWGGESKAL